MLPSKIEAIQKLIPPHDNTGMRRIIRLTGIYHHFIKDFVESTKPLTTALKGDNIKEKNIWTAGIKKIFWVAEYPVLQFPNFKKEFILETNASLKRIAALRNQLKNGWVALVSCDSRVLSKHKWNCSIPEPELMKMKKRTSRISRILLQLQEHNFYFPFQPGNFPMHQVPLPDFWLQRLL